VHLMVKWIQEVPSPTVSNVTYSWKCVETETWCNKRAEHVMLRDCRWHWRHVRTTCRVLSQSSGTLGTPSNNTTSHCQGLESNVYPYLHRAKWHSSATLTEVFPHLFLSCKANARVKPTKMGHGLHSSKFFCRSVYCLCVNVYCTTAIRWLPNCSEQIYHIFIYFVC
jgi:hypothetical protein